MSSGRFGNALEVQNSGTHGTTKLSLGTHENDCLGNLTLCPDGVTISFWIYMFKQSHQWPAPIVGSTFYFICKTPSTNPVFRPTIYNGTHEWNKETQMIYDYWHHFAFVYTAKDGLTWYSDGYRHDPITPGLYSRGSRNLEMGCLGTRNCAKAKYDDLRVWNEAKDEKFIWRLWQL